MKRLSKPRFASLFCLALLASAPGALHAQATKIFIASFGNDANDGSRGAPKRNLQAAHDAVAADGEIVVLDTAGYGRLTINKSVSVVVPPGVNGFVTATGPGNAITIAASSSAQVALRGLIIEGNGGGGGSSSEGIFCTAGVGSLTVEDCTIRNFSGGIAVLPPNSSRLFIRNTTVRGCGIAMEFDAVAGSALTAVVSGCQVEGNQIGITASAASSGTSADLTVADCAINTCNTAVIGSGAGAVVRASNCTITDNGLCALASSGATVVSRGNNTSENNDQSNGFPATYSAK